MKIVYGQELVNELRRICDSAKNRLWIAVPFIGKLNSVSKIIGTNWISKKDFSFRLLTDTNEFSNFNSETINAFFNSGEIRNLPGLHAKIYIIDDICLLTSANLTNTAFTKRHEFGVFLDIKNSENAIELFADWWGKSEIVSSIEIQKITKQKKVSTEEVGGEKLKSLWRLPESNDILNYWLKPIGERFDPITSDRKFGEETENLHFSKTRPSGVKQNDMLILYGVGAKKILSIYQNTSSPAKVTDAAIQKNSKLERWPWFVVGKNLTPNFGENWDIHNLVASELVTEYLVINPSGYITKRLGKNLNALMRGLDKINLDPDFARFIVNKVIELNN
jgi:hypothetical protein